METGISSSIVTFGTSKQNGSRKKLWYLILSQGSQYDGAIDREFFQKSVLKILNSENTRKSTISIHHERGWCYILILFTTTIVILISDEDSLSKPLKKEIIKMNYFIQQQLILKSFATNTELPSAM